MAHCSETAATLVGCAAGADFKHAAQKVLRDLAALKIVFRTLKYVPDRWEDFSDLLHGATYMARVEQMQEFDFLTKGHRAARSITGHFASVPSAQDLVDRLRANNMQTYVVDLSTDEAVRSGIYVVRVIIPDLQPFSLRYTARYLGHPRLYEASESEINSPRTQSVPSVPAVIRAGLKRFRA